MIAKEVLDQLEREIQQLDHFALNARDGAETLRYRREAEAKRAKLTRLRSQRTDGIRFA